MARARSRSYKIDRAEYGRGLSHYEDCRGIGRGIGSEYRRERERQEAERIEREMLSAECSEADLLALRVDLLVALARRKWPASFLDVRRLTGSDAVVARVIRTHVWFAICARTNTVALSLEGWRVYRQMFVEER
jgi:hypothetical protein